MQSGSDTSSADQTASPSVRVVVPTFGAGPWFDDVVSALSTQDYPAASVTLIHGDSDGPLLERQTAALEKDGHFRSVDVIERPKVAGFGEKVNAVAESCEETLLLILHDDVALEPGTISTLVREWLRRRNDATLVGAKLIDWSDSKRLMPAGFYADRFGEVDSVVNAGDLDQGQQDRVADAFGTSTACLLVSREFFVSIGGFDEAVAWHGEAHDLALRARSVGGEVVVAGDAVARHRGAYQAREGSIPDKRSRGRQMRSILAASPTSAVPSTLFSFVLLHLVEMVAALTRFDFRELVRIPGAWLWNVANYGSLAQRRSLLLDHERFNPDDLKLVRQRGSIRLTESVDRRVAEREVASESGDGSTLSIIRGAGGIAIAALMLFGGRRLISSDIPEIGEFRAIPDDLGTLTGDWFSGLRDWGLGSEGFASFALPLLDVAGLVLLGSASALEFVIIVAPLPIGVVGAWRLFHRSRSDWAPVASALLYAASPLPYNAIAGGSASALWIYAALPWIFANLVAVAQPAGAVQVMLGRPRTTRTAAVAMTFALAILVAFTPFVLLSMVIFITGLVLGSLLSGDMRGVFPILSAGIASLTGAAALNAPYLLGIGSWEQFASSSAPVATDIALTDILTLSNGPAGSSILGWAIFAPAILPLLLGVGQKFTWAMRVWGAILLSFGIAWLVIRGWLPVGMPVLEVLLAPVALGFAVLGGLTAVTIEVDLEKARLRVLVVSAIAVIGAAVATVPLLDVASTGRWELARVDLSTTLSSIEPEADDGTYRVLWIGDAHVLGAASVPTSNDLAWATSLDGTPDVRALWGGLDTGATALLGDVVDAGIDGRNTRLGRQLAEFGVRFIVVVDQQAPVPEVSRRNVVTDAEAAALNGQLDLVRDGVVNPAVTIYRNTAWAPVHSAVAPANLDPLRIEDAEPAVIERIGHDVFRGQTRDGRDIFASWDPSLPWVFSVDGQVAPRIDAGNTGIGFETAATPSTEAEFVFMTPALHRIIIGVQAIFWVLLFVGRRFLFSSERRQSRAELTILRGDEVIR